jgi:hypothetical protein
MSAAAGGRSAVSTQVSNHASLADFSSWSAGQPLIHSGIEGVYSTQRSQRHFQDFSVLSFGAVGLPSSLYFAYEAGADECSIWGIIAAASHTVVDVMPRIMRYELRDYEWTAKARIHPNWAVHQ